MSDSVKGTTVSYYHSSLQGAIHSRQAVKPRAEHLQLLQLLQRWFVSLSCPWKAQCRTVTHRNQQRGWTEAESEAMCYLEAPERRHNSQDDARLFKFIISVMWSTVLVCETLHRMLNLCILIVMLIKKSFCIRVSLYGGAFTCSFQSCGQEVDLWDLGLTQTTQRSEIALQSNMLWWNINLV